MKQIIRHSCLALIAVLCFACAAHADEGARPLPNFNAVQKDEVKPDKTVVSEEVGQLRYKAARGDADAQEQLAEHYEDGDGVKQNFGKAAEWLERSANQGNAKAQNKLGYFYMRGLGVPQSFEEAYFWITISSGPLDTKAAGILSELKKTLSPEKLSQQQRRIVEWAPEEEDIDPIDVVEDQDENETSAADAADENLCKGYDIAGRTAPLPRRAQRVCRKSYDQMRSVCFDINSCDDCEAALKSFIVACRKTTTAKDANPAFMCDVDSDCHLIETSYCEVEYQPLAVNREHLQEVRRARNIPVVDCHRPADLKSQYRAVCSDHMCEVKKSEP